MRFGIIAGISLAVVAAGCNSPNARLNAPPHGAPLETVDSQGTFVYMSDNALLADMTVSDMHFVPHRAMLTTLGEQRLCRLASLMEEYGGTIRFDTDLAEQNLIDARTRTITGFLSECGLETTGQTVTPDMPGGEGIPAAEAVLIQQNLNRYKPSRSSSSGASAQSDADNGSSSQSD